MSSPTLSEQISLSFHPLSGKLFYAVLSLQSEPANVMSPAVWKAIGERLKEAENRADNVGLIIQSALKRDIFTAGNDLKSLYSPNTNKEAYALFWQVQQETLTALYTSRLTTLCIWRGACPAAGCMLGLCCDYRLFTGPSSSSVGLNEVALGLSVPKYWIEVLSRVVGRRKAEEMVLDGRLVPMKEALQIGLCDQIADKEKALEEAVLYLKKRALLANPGRKTAKDLLRKELADAWLSYAPQEAEEAWKTLTDPKVVKMLGAVLERLSGGEKKKSKL